MHRFERLALALTLALALATTRVQAEEASRTPDQLNESERGQMIEGANAYGSCLATEAGRLKEEPDPRTIADKAMEACGPQLDELQVLMDGLGLDKSFSEGFRNSTRDRAARRLLGLLMEIKGQGAGL